MEKNGNKTISDFKNKLRSFLEKNRTLKFSLPLLVVLGVILIIVYSNQGIGNIFGGSLTAEETLNEDEIGRLNEKSEDKVEVLPNIERSFESQTGEQVAVNSRNNALYDPFQQPMILSGILYDANGKSVAIIETSEKSYVVIEGDNVNTNWEVTEIANSTVVLKSGEKEITLDLSVE